MRTFLVSASSVLLVLTLVLATPLAHAQNGGKKQDEKMAQSNMSRGKRAKDKIRDNKL
ncbi:hypothetical protein [Hymenobacter profundi]|uniref:Pentapeptide MXKDX repeat protein n=1 Tax=Hymenobacter profundi TaxID=1982110 RepID=A0ABS6WVV3_9BACT|nr:hypothetical protein [Hymenobacter profundi]MBW3127740.1 hypothetical protein [Hymenobacter profundi]